MKKIIILISIFILLYSFTYICITRVISNKVEYLWNNTISLYIKDDLWNDINAYDAGHVLLIPMFYAFQQNDMKMIQEFNDLFNRYSQYLENNNYEYKYWDINHMQFNFLASNYLVLCQKNGFEDKVQEQLINYLYDECFFYSLLKRESYKKEENPQYSALIVMKRDVDLNKPINDLYQYHFMVMFNLNEFSENSNKYKLSINRKKTVNESIEIMNYAYKNAVTFIDKDRWLLNLGSFDNHEDYSYMNYNEIEENMLPSENENTTWDTSHFARIPVFLQILKKANKNDTEIENYYEKLIFGLRKQFTEVVLIEPNDSINYYRTTNYMDGRNGIYRYNYETQPDNAYLPYQLSGTLMLGWWCFLGRETSEIYYDMYHTFPLTNNSIKTYTGPNTTRKRNIYMQWPDYLENGFAELICLLASKLDTEKIF